MRKNYQAIPGNCWNGCNNRLELKPADYLSQINDAMRPVILSRRYE